MELRHLRYFIAVAEELNFRRAAERLHLAQPPLSSQIKDLEEELGTPLFDRSTRSVKLTAAGKIFLEEARAVLLMAQRATQNVRNAHHGLIGPLRIGVLAPSATPRLARILSAFRKQFPNVHFSLAEFTSTEQLQRLRDDQLDVGLLRPPVTFPELEFLFLETSPMVLAAPAEHRLAKARKIYWSDFDNEKMVMIHPALQHGYYDKFLELCAKAGSTPVLGQYANDIHSKMWLISAGFGIAPTTKTIAEVKRPGLVFRELPPGLPLVETLLVWKRSNNSPVLRNFLDCFAALAKTCENAPSPR
ncbi:MAG TPA: LysR substrate-binding domain-containing protein [Verrucomicrobiae bacterium]|nr:LysR substrate-binding domain-containing protein [Verrucomicrobiae bacterium]